MSQNSPRTNVILVAWGFDLTFSPDSIGPLFPRFTAAPDAFWAGLDQSGFVVSNRSSNPSDRLNRILSYAQTGPFKGLNNRILNECGSEIPLYDGLPGLFDRLSSTLEAGPFVDHGIRVEHCVVSSGISTMIAGSRIGPYVTDVLGSEFNEESIDEAPKSAPGQPTTSDPMIDSIRQVVDGRAKTTFLLDLGRRAGTGAGSGNVGFRNMLYVAGSLNSVGAFDALKQRGGRTFAVYDPGDSDHYEWAQQLQLAERVDGIGATRYGADSPTEQRITDTVSQIAWQIMGRCGDAATRTAAPREFATGANADRPQSPLVSTGSRRKLLVRPSEHSGTAPDDAISPAFLAACRLFLGKNFELHATTLAKWYSNHIGSLCDWSAFMAELEKSVTADVPGVQRRAAKADNSDAEKLLRFLDDLYRKHKIDQE
jgi:hypothetical protein